MTGSLRGSVSNRQAARFLLELTRSLFTQEYIDAFIKLFDAINEIPEGRYDRDFCDLVDRRVPS